MNFQICNAQHPNSPTYTCIFCIFLSYDSTTNLHIGLDKYKDQVKELSRMTWRYMYTDNIDTVLVLNLQGQATGDYELLSKMYGITGANGNKIILC